MTDRMRHALEALERSPILRDAAVSRGERWRVVDSLAGEWMVSDDERRILHRMTEPAERA